MMKFNARNERQRIICGCGCEGHVYMQRPAYKKIIISYCGVGIVLKCFSCPITFFLARVTFRQNMFVLITENIDIFTKRMIRILTAAEDTQTSLVDVEPGIVFV